jgi:hypothetical protein
MSKTADKRVALLLRRERMLAAQSDDTLLEALALLDAQDALTQDERMTYAWIVDELERRHPEIEDELEEGFRDNIRMRTYGAHLAEVLS